MHIPNPCHEDWSKMTPAQHGRVCGQCNSLVADMTRLSNNEILALISKGNIHCGRFYEDQLTVPQLNSGWLKDWFGRLGKEWMFVSVLAMLELAAPSALKAKATLTEQVENGRRDFAGDTGQVMPGYIQGSVVRNSGNTIVPVQGRLIRIYNSKGKHVGEVTTDDRGIFAYALPDGISQEEYRLVLKGYKYSTRYRRIHYHKVTATWSPAKPWTVITEESTSKRKLFAPKRIIRTGRFRYDPAE